MNKRLPACAAVAVLASVGPPALTAEDAAHREHGPHVHGVARLDLAQEGPELQLRLDSPAVNIIGFEHPPRDEAQHVTLERAVAALKDGAALFKPTPGAGCTLAEVSVSSALLDTQEAGEAQGSEQGHQEEGHGHGDAGDAHADIEAEYRFLCERPQELRQVRVLLFESFPRTERLEVQMVTERGQAGATLTGADPELRF